MLGGASTICERKMALQFPVFGNGSGSGSGGAVRGGFRGSRKGRRCHLALVVRRFFNYPPCAEVPSRASNASAGIFSP